MRKTVQGSFGWSDVPCAPYPELPSILRHLVDGVQHELSENLVGVYLVGSLATGDFDLDSDIDFLVAIRNELSDEVVGSLQALHAKIYEIGCYPAQHLEGSYITQIVLNRADMIEKPLWYLDNGSIVFERSAHDNRWHVRWVLRERGITLVGPNPKSLLEPVPVELLYNEVSGLMRYISDLFAADLNGPLSYWTSRFGQSYTVLTYCRMLHTLKTGTVQSKLAGMNWALQNLDPKWAKFIKQAWKERKGVRHMVKIRQRALQPALEETMAFIKYAVREIDHM